MGAPATEMRAAAAGPAPTAVVDGMEVAQAIQDITARFPSSLRRGPLSASTSANRRLR